MVDAGFGTGYWGVEKRSFGNPVVPRQTLPANSDGSYSYGFNIFSAIQLKIYIEIMQTYYVEYLFNFIPAQVAPFVAQISWNRPWIDTLSGTNAQTTRTIAYTTWTEFTVGKLVTIVR